MALAELLHFDRSVKQHSQLVRVLHSLTVVGWVITSGVLLCYVAPCVLINRAMVVEGAWTGWRTLPEWSFWGLWLLLLGIGVLAVWRYLWWVFLILACMLNIAALAYLRLDFVPMTSEPALGPLADEGESTRETLAWMMEKHPKSRITEIRLQSDVALAIRLPVDRREWLDHVRAHRQLILDAWESDALGREWTEVLSQPTPAAIHLYRHDAPMLSFQCTRSSLYARTAYAYLIAVEGKRDDALKIVLPELLAWQHLQRSEGMLVHQMIAAVMIKESMKTIDAILDLGPASPTTLEAVRGALENACPIGDVFRIGFIGDYFYSCSYDDFVSRRLTNEEAKIFLGTLGLDANALVFQSRLFGFSLLMPGRTWRSGYLDALKRVVSLAVVRDLETLDRMGADAARRWTIKNSLGVRFTGMALPAFAKISKHIWDIEDARVSLLNRVEKLVGENQ